MTEDTSLLVESVQLTKAYGQFTALSDCSFSVAEGEVCGLLGPNGAGKSTLLRLLMGFMRPTSGRSSIAGYDCYRHRVDAHNEVAYLPGDPRLFRWLRGRQVLEFFAKVRSRGDLQAALNIARRLDLDLRRRVAFMSTGMRQKLALAAVLAAEVPLLILDEPTSNLDPNVRDEVGHLVQEAKAAGRTVLFSSHVLSEVEEVCDRVIVLKQGKLVHQQDMDELKNQHRIHAQISEVVPEVPEELKESLQIHPGQNGDITIDAMGELPPVLAWLGTLPLTEMRIESLGLKRIYDRIHPRK